MPDSDNIFNAALRIMDGMRLTEAFGHLSERDAAKPDVVRITPAMGPGLADASKCVRFDLSGKRLPGNDGLPAPLETPMHLAIYRVRKDVNAICRTHSPFAVDAGAVFGFVPCLHGFSLMLGRKIPVHDDIDLIHSVEQAEALVKTLGDANACLVRGNGALAVGIDIQHAVVHAIYLEEACRIVAVMGPVAASGAMKRITDAEYEARCKWHTNEAARAWVYYNAKFSGNLNSNHHEHNQ
jgi:HCOMODA/2-hydroxy-3-carboxy-muconic semialdehyde decarboxylase